MACNEPLLYLFNKETMIQETAEKFEGAVSIVFQVPKAGIFTTALLKFSQAPTTAENIIITFKSGKGTDFDTIIYEVDPSNPARTDIIYSPSVAIPLNEGDKIEITYANTDTRTIAVIIKGLDSSSF